METLLSNALLLGSTVECRYYVPGKNDLWVLASKTCGLVIAPIELVYFSSWIICSHTLHFSQFLCRILTVPRRKKSRKYVFGGFSPGIYFFSPMFLSHSGSNLEPARMFQIAYAMGTRCTIYEQSGHALDFEWHVYIAAGIADTQHL